MRLIRDIDALPAGAEGAAIAIGNFDGLHLGHQSVLAAMRSAAKRTGGKPSVLTFEPHPRMFFRKSSEPLRVEPFHIKMKRMAALGVEQVFILRFNEMFSQLSAEAFAVNILAKKLRAAHIVTGENFVFGHKRSGSREYLETLAAQGMFGYTAVSPVEVAGAPCSSSHIRDALGQGDVEAASVLLGREYEVFGRIQRGAGRGKDLGFPTMNIRLQHLFAPRAGVYAVEVAAESSLGEPAPVWHPGVANWGTRPTFDGLEKVFEIHLLQGQAFDYGQRIRVALRSYIREERKFPDIGALTRQISEDTSTARKLLACP